jgi:Lysine methyltransferase
VLELGSGTGLVGLVAGYLGARVCITDQAYVISSSPNRRLRHRGG